MLGATVALVAVGRKTSSVIMACRPSSPAMYDNGRNPASCREDQVHNEERKVHEHNNEQDLRGKQFVPIVRTRNPKLPVPHKIFCLHATHDQDAPRDRHQPWQNAPNKFQKPERERWERIADPLEGTSRDSL